MPVSHITDEQYQQYQQMFVELVEKLGSVNQLAGLMGINHGVLYNHRNKGYRPMPDAFEKMRAAHDVVFADETPPEVHAGVHWPLTREEAAKEAASPWTPPPPMPSVTSKHGSSRSVLDTLGEAKETLDQMFFHLQKAREANGEFHRLMGLAYDNATPLVARGIKSAVEELSETRKLLGSVA